MAKMKLKTHGGAKKRFKKTASGKVKYKKQGARHLLVGKSPKRMRSLAESTYVCDSNMKRVNRMLPNG